MTNGSSLSWWAPMLIYSHLPGGRDMDVRCAYSPLSTFGFLFAGGLTFLGGDTGLAGFDGDSTSALTSGAGGIWGYPPPSPVPATLWAWNRTLWVTPSEEGRHPPRSPHALS
ncbi:hypothetical protein Fot_23558 [Forsythia ovata]|uniref:Uncharacterized protein n=1 Tax=Forsythia ovata TaxID=205694 RepID=A0ABD1V0X8_9LAMI